MTWGHRPFDPDLEALIERARLVRPVPDIVRARVFARARAAASTPRARFPLLEPEATTSPRRRQALAVAAAVAMMVGAAGTAAALFYRARQMPVVGGVVGATLAPRSVAPVVESVPAPVAEPLPAEAARPAPAPSPRESYAAELRLLRRTQAAHSAGRFGSVVSLANEHARRFPHGRLAEEREALRVSALLASGRKEDARRAVATFSQRFPRSVLLPRLQEEATTAH